MKINVEIKCALNNKKKLFFYLPSFFPANSLMNCCSARVSMATSSALMSRQRSRAVCHVTLSGDTCRHFMESGSGVKYGGHRRVTSGGRRVSESRCGFSVRPMFVGLMTQ